LGPQQLFLRAHASLVSMGPWMLCHGGWMLRHPPWQIIHGPMDTRKAWARKNNDWGPKSPGRCILKGQIRGSPAEDRAGIV
jgi:hypothetical protein